MWPYRSCFFTTVITVLVRTTAVIHHDKLSLPFFFNHILGCAHIFVTDYVLRTLNKSIRSSFPDPLQFKNLCEHFPRRPINIAATRITKNAKGPQSDRDRPRRLCTHSRNGRGTFCEGLFAEWFSTFLRLQQWLFNWTNVCELSLEQTEHAPTFYNPLTAVGDISLAACPARK